MCPAGPGAGALPAAVGAPPPPSPPPAAFVPAACQPFSLHKHGFRFTASELAVLEARFRATGGATPRRTELGSLAVAFSTSAARGGGAYPVTPRQIKARATERPRAGARAGVLG